MDPFALYMDHWAPSVGSLDAFMSWLTKERASQWSFYVMPDLTPFRDTTGVVIESRAKYREHLKRVGGFELGPSDVAQLTARHQERKTAHAEKMRRASSAAPVVDAAPLRPVQSAISARVAERLHGRPTPDRKTLINIAIEEATRRRK